eukprot:scaffold30608_cov52-Cyclotella_meneghiniana.AAC.1
MTDVEVHPWENYSSFSSSSDVIESLTGGLVLVIVTSPSSSHFPYGSHRSILAKHASLVSNNYAACSGKHNNTSCFNQGYGSQTPNPNTYQHSTQLLTFYLTRLSLGGGRSRNNGPGCTAATQHQLNCDDVVAFCAWLCSAFDGFKQTTNITVNTSLNNI